MSLSLLVVFPSDKTFRPTENGTSRLTESTFWALFQKTSSILKADGESQVFDLKWLHHSCL